MKILDRYILQSFFKPFFSTFLIALFILIMQALWLIFDDMAGKGVTLGILVKYVFYVSVVTVPQAIPIATLLSSIMTMGNLSEKYEFAAIKSAGISLQRLLMPLFGIVLLLSVVNLYFLNNAFPWAVLKQKNLYSNIKKKKPALALVAGTFNTDIPNYVIKFDEKYGEEDNKLKNVLIYQTEGSESTNSITAKRGTIYTEEGSKYMSFLLEDGYYYEEHWGRGSKKREKRRMPFSKTHFDKYTINIDVSLFVEDNFESENIKSDREMLSFEQLNIYSDSLKILYDDFIVTQSNVLTNRVKADRLNKLPDSVNNKNIKLPILSNFDLKSKITILQSANNTIDRSTKFFSDSERRYKYKRKKLNMIDKESHRRVALSLSALLLFLIGAPLGSLIKKGGFGFPMVLAIIIYLTYHFSSAFAGNMAETSTVNHIVGGWLSTLIFLPIGLFLSFRATKDKGAINIDSIFNRIKLFFEEYIKKRNTD